jgi:membrane glycosyltransferase
MMMLTQSVAVIGAALGRDVGWQVQRRDDGSLPLAEIVRLYAWHSAFGLLLAAAAYAISIPLFLWMSPVLAGLLLAIPLAVITGNAAIGVALRRRGFLLIPEERDPPLVVRRAREIIEDEQGDGNGTALRRLVADPRLSAAHRAMLAPKPRRRGQVDVNLVVGLAKLADAESLDDVPQLLTRAEQVAVLSDPQGFARVLGLAAKRAV